MKRQAIWPSREQLWPQAIWRAYALRPQPFFLGVIFALCGLVLSLFFVRESHAHATLEAAQTRRAEDSASETPTPSFAEIVAVTSWKNRTLFAACQAGLVNNLNDGLSWGLFPLYFAAAGLDANRIGVLVAVYPAVWGVGQMAYRYRFFNAERENVPALGISACVAAPFLSAFSSCSERKVSAVCGVRSSSQARLLPARCPEGVVQTGIALQARAVFHARRSSSGERGVGREDVFVVSERYASQTPYFPARGAHELRNELTLTSSEQG
jgi:hypothetical protein